MPEIFIPFAGGIDEATSPELVNPQSAVLVLQNGLHDKKGSISKSRGCVTTPYTTTKLEGGSITTGRALSSIGDALVMVDDAQAVRAWSPGFAKWANAGELPFCDVSRTPIAGIPNEAPYTTAVYGNGVYVVGWIQARGSADWVRTAVVEQATGVVLAEAWLDDTDHFRMAIVGDDAVAMYEDSGGAVRIASLDTTDPASGWTARTSFTGHKAGMTSANGTLLYDIMATDATHFVVAYPYGSGTSRVGVLRYETVGWTLAHTINIATASTDPEQISIAGDDVLWVLYSYGTAARVVCVSLADLTTIGTTATWHTFTATPWWATVVSTGTQTADVIGCDYGNAETYKSSLSIGGGACVAASSAGLPAGPVIGASHAFRLSSRNYVLMYDETQTSFVLVDWTETPVSGTFDPLAVATFAQRLVPVSIDSVNGGMHQRAMAVSGVQALAVPVKRSPGTMSVEVVEFDFAPEVPTRTKWGESLQFSGGIVTQYDGRNVEEVNHITAPLFTTSNVAGALAAGTYQHIIVCERQDANGNWHPSANSATVTSTLGAPGAIRLTMYPPLSRKADVSRFRFAIYRSLTAASAPYYFVAYASTPAAGALYVTYDDAATDATISANAKLYIQPGAPYTSQPRRSPPALKHLTVHRNRIFGAAEDGVSVWYSAERVLGEGAWFADAFQMQVEQGGEIQAIWSQAGRLVVAKTGSLYVIDGSGPPENGGNGTEFTSPQRLPSDVGCVNDRSVVPTDMGTFFQSSRGIEILTRAFQVGWIGEPIEDTLAAYPVIASAGLDDAEGLVRFACVDDLDTPTAGRVIVYDLNNKAWSVHAYADEAVDHTVHGSAWHWLSAGGQVYQERTEADASAYLDASTWRTLQVETGWIKLAGINQEAAVRKVTVFLEAQTHSDVTVAVAYDDGASYDQSQTWTAAEVDGLYRPHLELDVSEQKCRSLKVKVSDATPTDPGTYPVTTGQGPRLYGVAVEYDVIGGARRREDGAR